MADQSPKLTPNQIAWAYCENEYYSGYACQVPGCPTCGGEPTEWQLEQARQAEENENANQ